MATKMKLFYKGEMIKASEKAGYWKLEFANGSTEKLYHHIDKEQNAIWMWESGKIDELSQAIGKLIDEPRREDD